jgi:hypothetical protein
MAPRTRSRRDRTAAALVAGLTVLGLAAAGCGGDDASTQAGGGSEPEATEASAPVIDAGDGGHYAPAIDPANFVTTVDNPYMPLAPGARWVYDGTADGEPEHTEVVVTDRQKVVMGIPVVVVRDTVSVRGEVIEDTYDWFAQDRDGNVWYMGEDSKEYEDGQVTSTEGSWEAGVDGALPGIVMQAHPALGQAYRQEYYPGQAEDMAEVSQVGSTKQIGLGEYRDVLVIKEWNPLEPDVVEQKYYAPGIGVIAEDTVTGGDEQSELTGT